MARYGGEYAMRLCLACRRLSSDTPLCSHCGRSFGGRLCNNKKGRHLNPATAQHYGQCGSTVLTEAATSIPLSGIARLLTYAALRSSPECPAACGGDEWAGGGNRLDVCFLLGSSGSGRWLNATEHFLSWSLMPHRLRWGSLLAGVLWAAPGAIRWIGDATGYSHYRDPRVWLIETTARLLMPFGTVFVLLYVFSHMVPGEGGKLLRHALVGTTMWVVRGLLNTIGGIAKGLGKLLSSQAQGTKNSTKTKL